MSRGTILFIDDDMPWSETAARVLEEAGFEVRLAHDGDQALDLLAQETPALVILDVHLPRLNGLQLLRDFRERNRSTPVLMVSADDQAGIQDRAMADGAWAFLRKPLALPLLVRAVERYVAGIPSQGKATEVGTDRWDI